MESKDTSREEKDTAQESLDLYKSGIEGLYDINSDVIVGNSISEHAALLYELFFKKAKEKIRIYCKNLCQLVFDKDDVIAALKQAKENKVDIDIMITDPEPESKKFTEALNELGIEIKKKVPLAKISSGQCINFCTVDDRAYRYEENNSECKASACFYNPSMVRVFENLFDKIKTAKC